MCDILSKNAKKYHFVCEFMFKNKNSFVPYGKIVELNGFFTLNNLQLYQFTDQARRKTENLSDKIYKQCIVVNKNMKISKFPSLKGLFQEGTVTNFVNQRKDFHHIIL